MMGVKGMEFLEAVWEKASLKGCKCNNDSDFAQDVLGAVRCDKCKDIIITQIEVNEMERNGELPTPNISVDKLENWFNR